MALEYKKMLNLTQERFRLNPHWDAIPHLSDWEKSKFDKQSIEKTLGKQTRTNAKWYNTYVEKSSHINDIFKNIYAL